MDEWYGFYQGPIGGYQWPETPTPAPSPDSGTPWWSDILSQGVGVAGAVLTHSPYIDPNDPRYRYPAPSTQQQAPRAPYPAGYPGGTYPAGSYPSDTGAGIRLSNQTLIFIGIGVLAFMLGQRRR